LSNPTVTISTPPTLDENQIKALAQDIYNFALPIALMDATMAQTTNVPNANAEIGHAPVNEIANMRGYPRPDAKEVVRFNFDTLYSPAWIDLSRGPVILSVPDTGGRYYLMPTLDMWTDVFATIGSRTTGTKAGHYAYVPRGWQGTLPVGIVKIEAPTSLIWLIGRTQCNGVSDISKVNKIQDGYKLTPLAQWGKDEVAIAPQPINDKIDTKTPPMRQILKLSGVDMFKRLAELMKKHPPHQNDYPILFRMKALGLEPGSSWDPNDFETETIEAINAGAAEAKKDLQAGLTQIGKHINGWSLILENIGTYGTCYRQRACVAVGGLGANLPEDAVYPTAFLDSEGKPLDGSKKYVIHFEKGKLPPAEAFWSITMYDGEGYQVPNKLNRFAIGDRDKLAYNKDGSLDIYLQTESPGVDKESNWLPSPKSGAIGPTLRIYSPETAIFSGEWVPPPIVPA